MLVLVAIYLHETRHVTHQVSLLKQLFCYLIDFAKKKNTNKLSKKPDNDTSQAPILH